MKFTKYLAKQLEGTKWKTSWGCFEIKKVKLCKFTGEPIVITESHGDEGFKDNETLTFKELMTTHEPKKKD